MAIRDKTNRPSPKPTIAEIGKNQKPWGMPRDDGMLAPKKRKTVAMKRADTKAKTLRLVPRARKKWR